MHRCIVLKTGASGMIAYRLQTRDGSWQWLQTSSRLVYKNSKPDFIICTHRPLMYVCLPTRTPPYLSISPRHLVFPPHYSNLRLVVVVRLSEVVVLVWRWWCGKFAGANNVRGRARGELNALVSPRRFRSCEVLVLIICDAVCVDAVKLISVAVRLVARPGGGAVAASGSGSEGQGECRQDDGGCRNIGCALDSKAVYRPGHGRLGKGGWVVRVGGEGSGTNHGVPCREEEGRDLLGKRTMDFKVSYLDPGLTQSYLCDSELPQLYASRMSRKYKTQLRDFLTTCKSRRSYTNLSDTAYNNYNNVYSASPYATDNGLYMQQNLGNLQSLYPTSYLPADNLFHYRQLGSYYPDYMTHGYVSNGYVDATRPCLGYDVTKTAADQKLYCATQLDASKYQYKPTDAYSAVYGTNTVLPSLDHKYTDLRTAEVRRDDPSALASLGALAATPGATSSVVVSSPTSLSHKEETKDSVEPYANNTRQTVLMWGSSSHDYDPNKKYGEAPVSSAPSSLDPTLSGVACKWGTATPASTPGARSSAGGSPHGPEGSSPHGGPPSAHSAHSAAVAAATASSAAHVGAGTVAPAGKAAYGYSEGGEAPGTRTALRLTLTPPGSAATFPGGGVRRALPHTMSGVSEGCALGSLPNTLT
ncbi:Aryl hydrocarbon receptor [Portunus trituberculatus]|uniref:Aryl hydrocarbon receptor n=1 Tax=Portunus trituberculatus TaxID=210409 RepID=A0A5B7FBL8_PORTR|nr:Aryl hydrocarbon receptor [Portunus trituberculatus]